jgi:hypothetical protein
MRLKQIVFDTKVVIFMEVAILIMTFLRIERRLRS